MENKKRRKFYRFIELPSLNDIKLHNSNNNSELGWYWYDSSDNLNNWCLDFSKEENNDKKEKSNKNKPIILSFLPAFKLAELSWNKTSKANLHEVWNKRSSATKEEKKRNVRKYQYQNS